MTVQVYAGLDKETTMGHFASIGWSVFDANGQPVGIVTQLSEPQTEPQTTGESPAFDTHSDEPTMIVDAAVGAPGSRLMIPLSAIRAAMHERLLLTEPSSRFAELGWLVQAEDQSHASTTDAPVPGPLAHRPATA
jgi:hypothetical protein